MSSRSRRRRRRSDTSLSQSTIIIIGVVRIGVDFDLDFDGRVVFWREFRIVSRERSGLELREQAPRRLVARIPRVAVEFDGVLGL